jgi:hypothetical protein
VVRWDPQGARKSGKAWSSGEQHHLHLPVHPRMSSCMPERPGLNDPMHYMGRLFHEWACDPFVSHETQQLQFVCLNQAAPQSGEESTAHRPL